MTPQVSVIVPAYNAAATLPRAVAGVQAQEGPSWELLLVDDGSTDGTPALCDEFAADGRIRVLHLANGGVSRARNAGLAACKGEYVVFLDADDTLLPGALSRALEAQKRAPDSWIIWNYTTESTPAPPAANRLLRYGPDCLARLYLGCLLAMPWNKLYRGDVARALRFDESKTLGEDLLYCLDYRRAANVTRYGIIEQPLTYYNCENEDESRLSTRFIPDYCPLWEALFARLIADCKAANCPDADLDDLYRVELQVLAEGAADILQRGPGPLPARKAAARAALASPALRALLQTLQERGIHAAYAWPVSHGWAGLVLRMAQSRRTDAAFYGKVDWLGWYLTGKRRRGA